MFLDFYIKCPAPMEDQSCIGMGFLQLGMHALTSLSASACREETEIIEGEVVEIQIDRPATGTVSCKF